MKKQDPKLYWKLSELSFDDSDKLWDAYNKLRVWGYNCVIRQTDETLLAKFIMTIAARKIPMSDLSKESYRLYKKTGSGLGKSYYYVKGTKIEYKLPNTDWDVDERVRFEKYEDALKERNRAIIAVRWKSQGEKK